MTLRYFLIRNLCVAGAVWAAYGMWLASWLESNPIFPVLHFVPGKGWVP